MNENEEKAQKFLDYVAKNEKELKKALKKNITYNADIFDDVYGETILKIYNTIIKNGTDIGDYKQYFYLSSKFTYILYDNRNKKKINREARGYFDDETNDIITEEDNEEKEERFNNALKTIQTIKETLTAQFNEEDAEMYMKYYQLKVNGKCNYKILAEECGKQLNETSEKMKQMKKFVNSSKEIKTLRENMYADNF